MTEDIIKGDLAQDSADEVENQIYEVGFHIVPSVEEIDLNKEVDAIKSLIEKNGGVFISEEFPKEISLAYTISKNIDGKIQKFDTAYFGWIKFEMKTNSILNVKNELDINKNILRFLIIKTVKESTLLPKTAVFTKDDTQKKSKTEQKTEQKTEKKTETKTSVSNAELDKTIEELIVE